MFLKIDIVVIDGDELLANSFGSLVKSYNKTIDMYYDPKHFLENISQYAKNTKIFMCNKFKDDDISGIELAKQLHEKGFTKLYLFSGTKFKKEDIPDFLTAILKTDINSLCEAIIE